MNVVSIDQLFLTAFSHFSYIRNPWGCLKWLLGLLKYVVCHDNAESYF